MNRQVREIIRNAKSGNADAWELITEALYRMLENSPEIVESTNPEIGKSGIYFTDDRARDEYQKYGTFFSC